MSVLLDSATYVFVLAFAGLVNWKSNASLNVSSGCMSDEKCSFNIRNQLEIQLHFIVQDTCNELYLIATFAWFSPLQKQVISDIKINFTRR